MNKLILLFFGLTISLISCDGRKNKNDALKESITKFKDSIKPTEIIKYFPEVYEEIETDTILNNGFRVKIKTFSNMEKNVLNDFTIDTIHYKYYYRNYTNKLEIFYQDRLIINELINKSNFKTDEDHLFWEDAILGGFSLEDSNTNTENVSIITFFCLVESEICKEYKITLDKQGNKTTEEIITESIH